MAKSVRRRGGTTEEHSNFVGAAREVTVDTTNWTLRVHDQSTKGGHPLAKKVELDAVETKVDSNTEVLNTATNSIDAIQNNITDMNTRINSFSVDVINQAIIKMSGNPYVAKGLPTANKTTITLQPMVVSLEDHIREITTPTVLDLSLFDAAANRKGKDIKIYVKWNGTRLEFKLGYTLPSGYTDATSLLIGGFHCECADIGTIVNHPLSGWLAGDILPASVWDMKHRPVSSPDGMVFSSNYLCWYDIYLQSGTGTNTRSVFNGTTTRSRTQSGHELDMLAVKKRLLTSSEFTDMSLGSNQKTAIQGAKEYTTTGGHVDTAGQRMSSYLGCEDACGLVWQWTDDLAYMAHGSAPEADTTTNMGGIWHTNALFAGGYWNDSVSCGSAARHADYSRLDVRANFSGRGRAACKSTY